MQHGGGQDQSDWMNIGSVPVIMDNLLQDGLTEPAVVITTNSQYLGSGAEGYPNLRNVVMPFVEDNYNVSTHPMDRAFAGLSMGSFVTQNIISHDPTLFGYYGPWSGGARFIESGKLTADESAELLETAQEIIFNLGYWQ